MLQQALFNAAPRFPDGWRYAEQFLRRDEEAALLAQIRALPFENAQYKEWHARRRIVAYGGRYDFSRQQLQAADPLPPFLWPLRARLAAWAELPAATLAHAMVAEYAPGTPLGWHRDVPDFEVIAGISLLGTARLRLRPWPPRAGGRTVHAIELAPRSAYLMRGQARWGWQHAISPTKELRYSITFRSRRP